LPLESTIPFPESPCKTGDNSIAQPNRISFGVWLVPPALLLFLIGIVGPCIMINEFGNSRRLSLLSNIRVLWDTGHAVLAILTFAFSVLFPPAKLVLTFVLGLPHFCLRAGLRNRISSLVEQLGKWSFLDVLVISVLIVTIKVQGYVSVQAAWGLYVFTASISLSMLATHCIRNPGSKLTAAGVSQTGKTVVPVPVRNQRSCLKFQTASALTLALSSVIWFLLAPPGNVSQIHVTRKETIFDLPRLFGSPSFYLQVRTLKGNHRLDTKPRTPIGNGLTWSLSPPPPLADIYEVSIFEEGLLADKFVDRVTVGGRRAIGQRFQFELQGRIDWQRPVAVLVGVTSIIMLILFRTCRRKRLNDAFCADLNPPTSTLMTGGEIELDSKRPIQCGIFAGNLHGK
jgi:paraquat-inducible protein A